MQNMSSNGKPAGCWGLVTLMALAVVWIQLFGTVSVAHASGWESGYWSNDGAHPDVISNCNEDSTPKPDSCYFHVVNHYAQLGSYRQVSAPVNQCNESGGGTFSINWSTTQTSTYSYSKGYTVSVVKGLTEDGITLGLRDTKVVTTTWTTSSSASTGGSVTVSIPAHHKGWITWAPRLEVANGWFEVHYGKRIDGHYFWYYPYQGSSQIQVTTAKQLPDGTADGRDVAVVVSC
jgi:hypothetical protein